MWSRVSNMALFNFFCFNKILGFSIFFMKLYGCFPQITFAEAQMSNFFFVVVLTLTQLYKEFDNSGKKY